MKYYIDSVVSKFTLIIITLYVFQLNDVYAQESSIYQNYILSPFIINPAITGSEYYPQVEISVKKQWAEIFHAPTTIIAAGNFKVGAFGFYTPDGLVNKKIPKLKERVGFGAALFDDQTGPEKTTGLLLSYAYHIPIANTTKLSFGLSFSGKYYSFNSSILNPDMPDDSYLFSDNESHFRTNFSFGTFYYSNIFFSGISVKKLLPDISGVNDNLEMQPSIFLIGGYKFFRDKPNNFEQTLTIKLTEENQIYIDFLSKIYVQQLNWIAFSYSTMGKINILCGIHTIKKFYVGYNYEYYISKIASYNGGSHQVYVGINLGLIKVDNIRKLVK